MSLSYDFPSVKTLGYSQGKDANHKRFRGTLLVDAEWSIPAFAKSSQSTRDCHNFAIENQVLKTTE